MDFDQLHAISDICLLVQDLDRSIAFYTEKLGFRIRRRAEGFVSFESRGVGLVVWQSSHLPDAPRALTHSPTRSDHRACVSVRLPSGADVDEWYHKLAALDVPFQRLPANYPWGARSCYFTDPDNILWELYAETAVDAFERVSA
jgi:catechol 2,3-dioxygenase-like lactoylglutathione lyase family enzyme